MFACPSCQRTYKRQNYYERHTVVCKILCKTKKERSQEDEERADTPTIRDLYVVVMELASNYLQLEKKMTEMSKWVNTKKQKLKITDWLNTNYMATTNYADWLTTIPIHFTRVNLEFIFNSDYITGLGLTLQQLCATGGGDGVLKAFTAKDNMLYIYANSTDQWRLMTDAEFITLMHLLDKRALIEFVQWQTENKPKMHLDDFAITYAVNVKKIMGNNLARDQIHARIRRELFKHIRREPPNITELEISF